MKQILSILITAALALLPLAGYAQDATIKTVALYSFAGAPVNGTSEVDTLTIQASTTSGTFTLAVAGGRVTQPITWSATNATLLANIDAALEALPVVGTGGVTTAELSLTAGIGTITLAFAGKNAAMDFPLLSIGTNALVGGAAPTVTTTTAGVAATFREAPTGAVLEDTTNAELYQNISTTALSPNWQIKGLGFKSGSGGAVVQATNRTTGVTLSKRTGKITTTATSLAALTIVTFTVTNTTVAATDTVVLAKVSGDIDTHAWVDVTAAGSFNVSLYNAHATVADTTAFVFNFTVIKGAID